MTKYRLMLKNGMQRIIESHNSDALQEIANFLNTCKNGYLLTDDLLISVDEILLFEKLKVQHE